MTIEQEHAEEAAGEGYDDRCRANDRIDERATAAAAARMPLRTMLVLLALMTFAATRDAEPATS